MIKKLTNRFGISWEEKLFIKLKITLFMVLSFHALTYTNGSIKENILRHTHNGAVLLYDENGKEIFSHNKNKLFIPASIIKVFTSQVALDILGKDYRFPTECYRNDQGDMIIKGYGDPFFVSDEIRLLAQGLKERGITEIRNLYLDHSYFSEDITIPGIANSSNPYDALNGALVVNFNTINVVRDKNGVVSSGESETPLTPLATLKGQSIRKNSKERINLSANKEDCQRYAEELIYVLFKDQGVKISNLKGSKRVQNNEWDLFYIYKNSRALQEILKGLMKYSNNFIANQIFLSLGNRGKSESAVLENGQKLFYQKINEQFGIPKSKLTLVEGSGISSQNKTTAQVMIEVLERFKPHASIFATRKGHYVKSGTLTGVYNYIGYIKTSKGLRSFVIMLNQKKNYRDTILKYLTKL